MEAGLVGRLAEMEALVARVRAWSSGGGGCFLHDIAAKNSDMQKCHEYLQM